jgi:hypothetical protein
VANTNPNQLPPIPQDKIEENPRWREWFRTLGSYIAQTQLGNIIVGVAQGGTGATSAAGARQNLGLGSMATEQSSNVSITGGTISGVAITGSTIPYSNVTGGLSVTITTAKLTVLGSNGSMTFTNGILTAQTQAT